MDILQYAPTYVDTTGTELPEIRNWNGDLSTVPFLEKWRQSPGFHKFSRAAWHLKKAYDLNPETGFFERWHVMAEFDGRKKWHVTAIVAGGAPDLPEWIPVR